MAVWATGLLSPNRLTRPSLVGHFRLLVERAGGSRHGGAGIGDQVAGLTRVCLP